MLVRRNTSWKRLVCIVIAMTLFLSGCSIFGVEVDKGTGSSTDTKTPKIGLITGESGIDDPYYKKAWEGFLKAEQELKVGIGYVKAKNDKEYPGKLAELKNDGYELVFTIGPNAVPAVLEAAKDNPKVKYVCLDSLLESPVPANVLGVTYKVEEPSFLAGYIAGKMTKSNVVGFISGDNKDLSLRYFYGYKAGLRFASTGSELMKGVAGTFTNKNRLEEMAESMVKSKADVIFHVAGTAGKGMIEVMKKEDKFSIGADIDQNYLATESVITSVIKNNDLVIYDIVKAYMSGSLLLGKVNVYGLKENAVDLAETTRDMVTDDVYNNIIKYKDDIITGKKVIPATENETLKQNK